MNEGVAVSGSPSSPENGGSPGSNAPSLPVDRNINFPGVLDTVAVNPKI